MKWMGWGWADYLSAPIEVVDEIARLINEEQAALDRIREEAAIGG